MHTNCIKYFVFATFCVLEWHVQMIMGGCLLNIVKWHEMLRCFVHFRNKETNFYYDTYDYFKYFENILVFHGSQFLLLNTNHFFSFFAKLTFFSIDALMLMYKCHNEVKKRL